MYSLLEFPEVISNVAAEDKWLFYNANSVTVQQGKNYRVTAPEQQTLTLEHVRESLRSEPGEGQSDELARPEHVGVVAVVDGASPVFAGHLRQTLLEHILDSFVVVSAEVPAEQVVGRRHFPFIKTSLS